MNKCVASYPTTSGPSGTCHGHSPKPPQRKHYTQEVNVKSRNPTQGCDWAAKPRKNGRAGREEPLVGGIVGCCRYRNVSRASGLDAIAVPIPLAP